MPVILAGRNEDAALRTISRLRKRFCAADQLHQFLRERDDFLLLPSKDKVPLLDLHHVCLEFPNASVERNEIAERRVARNADTVFRAGSRGTRWLTLEQRWSNRLHEVQCFRDVLAVSRVVQCHLSIETALYHGNAGDDTRDRSCFFIRQRSGLSRHGWSCCNELHSDDQRK